MVLKADGSKYACQSCLKGHRVSACTHTDRELFFVPKKGRPVTQCQHCRQERKKRSSHVRCDCGEPEKPHHSKEKCIHLREAEERAKAGFHDEHAHDKDPNHLSAVAEQQGCCCHHGGKCTCSLLKKEFAHDDAPHGPAVKPRLEKTTSDTSITVFSNGHHKPVHRKNHAAHECGMPYKMPMPRSHTDNHGSMTAARRSVDSLALDASNPFQQQAQFLSNHLNGLPVSNASRQSSTTEALPVDPMAASSGALSRTGSQINGYPGLTQTGTNQSMPSVTSDAMSYAPFETIPSASDGSFEPWPPFTDSMNMLDSNFSGNWMWSDNFNMAQPALTAGSSGTQSEVDEIPPSDDFFNNLGMPSIQEDVSGVPIPIPSGNSPQMNRRSLPASFFGANDFKGMNGAGMGNGDWENYPTDNSNTNNITTAMMTNDPVAAGKARFGMMLNGNNNSSTNNSNANSNAFLPFNNDPWQVDSVSPLSTSFPSRQIYGGPTSASNNPTGRPQSQSLGPSSAPSDDVMRQLFPDYDADSDPSSSSLFGSGVTGSPQEMSSATSDAMITSNPTLNNHNSRKLALANGNNRSNNNSSNPALTREATVSANAMDLTLMDDASATSDPAVVGFASTAAAAHRHNWNDGSMSIPSDPYTPASFDLGMGADNNWVQ